MLWSGSSPLAVVRAGMWGFLLFAGAAWLAIAWSVLRLQPSDIAHVAGPVVLFGALTEVVRALAGTRTWWLNAGMAALFAVTGVVLLADQDSSFTTPAALLGWYLMVRGAADIAMSMMTRETDRIWGLLMVVGVLETALGFFAASPLSRTADLAVTVLGGLALARAVADLVASLRLREVSVSSKDLLELPPDRAAGLAGYSAGLTDYEAAPASRGARHRAATRRAVVPAPDPGDWTVAEGDNGSPGAAIAGGMAGAAGDMGPTPTGYRADDIQHALAGFRGGDTDPTSSGYRTTGDAEPVPPAYPVGDTEPVSAGTGAADAEPITAAWTPAPGWTGAASWPEAAPSATRTAVATSEDASRFHNEVLRTTADLDAILALAGVAGAAMGAGLVIYPDMPEIPDTAEGAEESDTVEMRAVREH